MISFIIAVFHRPRLVVLDEPTIGLDVLKKNQYLSIFNSFKNVDSTQRFILIVEFGDTYIT